MTRKTISFTLEADLVERAEAEGILTESALTDWITRELDRITRARRFFADIDKLAAIEPRLSLAEIAEEIDAARFEAPRV